MGNKKITALPVATSFNPGDKIEVVQGGTNKQLDAAYVSTAASTLTSVLTTGDTMAEGQSIKSINSESDLSVNNVGITALKADGTNTSRVVIDILKAILRFDTPLITGYFKADVDKSEVKHDTLNEFNAPDNNFNGNVTAIRDVDSQGFLVEGVDNNRKVYIGNDADNSGVMSISKDDGSVTIYLLGQSGTIQSNGFITSGGISSQFVKGDGSLDSNSYVNTSKLITQSFTYTGAAFTLSNNVQFVILARLTNGIVLDDTDASDLTIVGTTATVTNPTFTTGDKFILKYLAQ